MDYVAVYQTSPSETALLLKEIIQCSNKMGVNDSMYGHVISAKMYLANLYSSQGQLDEVIIYLKSAESDFSHKDNLSDRDAMNKRMLDYLMGTYFLDRGLHEQAKEKYKQVIDDLLNKLDYEAKGFFDKEKVWNFIQFPALDLFNNAANTFETIGDFEQASLMYRIALSLCSEKDIWQTATVHQNFGFNCMQMGLLPKARQNFNLALDLMKSNDGAEFQKAKGRIYNNLARSYLLDNNVDSTLYFLNLSKKLELHVESQLNREELLSKANLKAGHTDLALSSIYNQKKLALDSLGNAHPRLAKAFRLEAEILLKLNKEEAALQAINKAIQTLSLNDEFDCSTLNVSELNSKKLALSILADKASILFEMENKDCSDCYFKIKELVDLLNTDYVISEYSKYDLAKEAKLIYEKAVIAFLKFGEVINAYSFAQEAKAMVLLFHVNNKEAINSGLLPEEVVAVGENAILKLNELRKKKETILSENANEDISELSLAIIEAQKKYDRWLGKVEAEYPLFYDLKYKDQQKPKLSHLQNQLAKNETIVEYLLGEEELISFIINERSIDFSLQKIDSSFVNRAVELYNHTSALTYDLSSFNNFVENSSYFYEVLIKPIQDQNLLKEVLTIIPDEEINLIPFDALIQEKNLVEGTINYQSQNYLLESHLISYHYSSELISKNDNTSSEIKFLGLAPSFQDQKIPVLKYNKNEIETINEKTEGMALLGEEATYSSFSEHYKDHNVIHFSTHGEFNDSVPLISHIKVADRPIYIYEFEALDHDFDLVVLSACETASGLNKKGEGLMSISRALIQSGCPTVISNMWSVSDQKITKQMIDFYGHLQNEMDSRVSLNLAKRTYLNNAVTKNTHPFYWAGLIHIGTPYQHSSQFSALALLSYAILLVFILFYLFRFIKR